MSPCLPAADLRGNPAEESAQAGASWAEVRPAAAGEGSSTVAAAEGSEGVAAGESGDLAVSGDVSNVVAAREDSCAVAEAVDQLVAEAQQMRLAMDRRMGGPLAAGREGTREVTLESAQHDAQAAPSVQSAQAGEPEASGTPTPPQSAGISAACHVKISATAPEPARPRLRLFDRLMALAPPLPGIVGVDSGAAVAAALKLAASEDDTISGGLSSSIDLARYEEGRILSF